MRPRRLLLLSLLALIVPAAVAHAAPEGPKLSFPLACRIGQTCEIQHYVDRDPGPGVRDYRCRRRTYDGHKGTDIRVPDMAAERRGVAVLAAAAGRVSRLRDGEPDISIRAPGAPPIAGRECGNGVVIDHGDGWETQYCHLARGSVRVKVGDQVQPGTPIAQVGLSGDTEFAHMHFEVRHGRQVIDPFAPDMQAPTCAAQTPMWTPQAAREMAYKEGAVMNAGFAPGPVLMAAVEAGEVPAVTADAPYLVFYVRDIGLAAGDSPELTLLAPGGGVLASDRQAPMTTDKDQHLAYVGKKRPGAAWPHGAYTAVYRLWRGGKVVLERRFQATL